MLFHARERQEKRGGGGKYKFGEGGRGEGGIIQVIVVNKEIFSKLVTEKSVI